MEIVINTSSIIRYHAQAHGDRTAIVYGDQRSSYQAFLERIEATAAWLTGQGLRAGDIVAVLMKNSPAYLDIAFATSHIGAVFLPINFRLSRDEVGYIIGNAEAKLLFVDHELAAAADGNTRVIALDKAAQADSSLLFGRGTVAPTPRRAEDLFRLMYTSGTTDRPKGVMHSYENFYWKTADHIAVLGLSSQTRLLVCGPLYHVGAFDLPGVAVFSVGGMICLHRDFDPRAILASIEKERLTGAWLAPVMTSALLSCETRDRYDVSSLKWVVGGGERTPEARIREFSRYFASARYIDAYGLTESCSGDTFMIAGREIEKIGSTGHACMHVDIEIRDDEGMPLPAGREGEICLRGPKVTKGYWKDPAKTAASFFGEWFRTGDVGYLDHEGFLFLTDRKKDMIISGGENIASSEVERIVYGLDQVSETAVIGLPDKRWGERPVAVVVLKPGTRLSYDDLASHCRSHLASFKVPKELILRESLPRNPSGKILKRQLRQEIASGS